VLSSGPRNISRDQEATTPLTQGVYSLVLFDYLVEFMFDESAYIRDAGIFEASEWRAIPYPSHFGLRFF
jgi:hypothetical protein